MENTIQKHESNAIQQVQVDQNASPLIQIAQLLASGISIDVEAMKAMQEMGERDEANEARRSFAKAFTLAQTEIEAVTKTHFNKQTNSKYAKLEDVIELSKPVYTKHGFSVIFYEGKPDIENAVRVYADILHCDGHKDTKYYDVPLDGKGIHGKVNMTPIHAKASSVTYGRRYLTCMIWNIPTPDDDGNAPPEDAPKIPDPNPKEIAIIDKICDKLPKKDGKVPNWDFIKKCVYICNGGKYMTEENRVSGAVEWLIREKSDAQLYKDDTRSQFERDYDIP